jgi:hypothetical protein
VLHVGRLAVGAQHRRDVLERRVDAAVEHEPCRELMGGNDRRDLLCAQGLARALDSASAGL